MTKKIKILIILIGNVILLIPLQCNFGIDYIWSYFFNLHFIYGRIILYGIQFLTFYTLIKRIKQFKITFLNWSTFICLFIILMSLICRINNPINFIPFLLSETFTSGKYESEIILLFDLFISLITAIFAVFPLKFSSSK